MQAIALQTGPEESAVVDVLASFRAPLPFGMARELMLGSLRLRNISS